MLHFYLWNFHVVHFHLPLPFSMCACFIYMHSIFIMLILKSLPAISITSIICESAFIDWLAVPFVCVFAWNNFWLDVKHCEWSLFEYQELTSLTLNSALVGAYVIWKWLCLCRLDFKLCYDSSKQPLLWACLFLLPKDFFFSQVPTKCLRSSVRLCTGLAGALIPSCPLQSETSLPESPLIVLSLAFSNYMLWKCRLLFSTMLQNLCADF